MDLTEDCEEDMKAVGEGGREDGVSTNSDIKGACTHRSVNFLAVLRKVFEDRTDHLGPHRNSAEGHSVK